MTKQREMDFGLDAEILKQIVALVLRYKKPERIVIFGSRAVNNFKKTSDIDIAIFAKDWTGKDINLVKNLLEERLKTALKIDIVNFYALTKEKLKANILKEGKVLYDPRKD